MNTSEDMWLNYRFAAKSKKPKNKPLKDWTLAEVKTECGSRGNCTGCPFENRDAYEYRICRLRYKPFVYKLDKEEKVN